MRSQQTMRLLMPLSSRGPGCCRNLPAESYLLDVTCLCVFLLHVRNQRTPLEALEAQVFPQKLQVASLLRIGDVRMFGGSRVMAAFALVCKLPEASTGVLFVKAEVLAILLFITLVRARLEADRRRRVPHFERVTFAITPAQVASRASASRASRIQSISTSPKNE